MSRFKPGWLLGVLVLLIFAITLVQPTILDSIDGRVGSFIMVAVAVAAVILVFARKRRL